MNFEHRPLSSDQFNSTSLPSSQNLPHVGSDGQPKHWRSPTRHLNFPQYVRLLGLIDEVGGIATLDEISRALPSVEQPVSAVLDLCDADILCGDWQAAFDGDMRIWRISR